MRNKSTRQTRPTTPCWIWNRARDGRGYGAIVRGGVTLKAHRFVYEALVGPIPDGLVLDHLCRTPACVNPDHLEPVTNFENARRGTARKLSREQAEEIRCDHARGVSMAHLALTYGVSSETIRQVVRRLTYRDAA